MELIYGLLTIFFAFLIAYLNISFWSALYNSALELKKTNGFKCEMCEAKMTDEEYNFFYICEDCLNIESHKNKELFTKKTK